MAQTVCQHYLRGQCRYGQNCRNLHQPNGQQQGFTAPQGGMAPSGFAQAAPQNPGGFGQAAGQGGFGQAPGGFQSVGFQESGFQSTGRGRRQPRGQQVAAGGFGGQQPSGFGQQPTGFGVAQPTGFGALPSQAGFQPTGFGTAPPQHVTGLGGQPTGFGGAAGRGQRGRNLAQVGPVQTGFQAQPGFGGISAQPSGFGGANVTGFGTPQGFGQAPIEFGNAPGQNFGGRGQGRQRNRNQQQQAQFGGAHGFLQPTGFGAQQNFVQPPMGMPTGPTGFGGQANAIQAIGGVGFPPAMVAGFAPSMQLQNTFNPNQQNFVPQGAPGWPQQHSQQIAQQQQIVNPNAKPCRDWMQSGTCRFGARCRFRHDVGGGDTFTDSAEPMAIEEAPQGPIDYGFAVESDDALQSESTIIEAPPKSQVMAPILPDDSFKPESSTIKPQQMIAKQTSKGGELRGSELQSKLGPAEYVEGRLSRDEEAKAFEAIAFQLDRIPENISVLYS